VYYDPPEPGILKALSMGIGLVMQFLGDVYGMYAHVLLHIVASHCCLNSSYARRIGLHVEEDNNKLFPIRKWIRS
jgi:hypothetical protein